MTSHLFIYGIIGDKPNNPRDSAKYYSLKEFREELDPAATDYVLHISSVGGDVFDGFTMYSLLKATGKPITAKIEGVCASIATLLAATADKVYITKTSMFIIHNPWVTSAGGDANDLRAVANQLDKIKNILVDVYEPKTKLDREKLWSMCEVETALTGEEAVSMGFADEISEDIKAVATANLKKMMQENNSTILESIEKQVKRIWAMLLRPKAQMAETLEDGTVIIVMSEDDNWTGKQVTYEDGTPVPAGDYTLQSGKTVSIDENSTITEVITPETEEQPTENPDDMINEQAQARIVELENELAIARQQIEEATTRTNELENNMKTEITNLSNQLNKFKNQTIGNPNPPKKKETAIDGSVMVDPMAVWFKNNILNARNSD